MTNGPQCCHSKQLLTSEVFKREKENYPLRMGTVIAWILGAALMVLAIGIPVAYVYSIRESYKASKRGTRKSYRSGWTNKPWK
jgi:hypothetical protein